MSTLKEVIIAAVALLYAPWCFVSCGHNGNAGVCYGYTQRTVKLSILYIMSYHIHINRLQTSVVKHCKLCILVLFLWYSDCKTTQ